MPPKHSGIVFSSSSPVPSSSSSLMWLPRPFACFLCTALSLLSDDKCLFSSHKVLIKRSTQDLSHRRQMWSCGSFADPWTLHHLWHSVLRLWSSFSSKSAEKMKGASLPKTAKSILLVYVTNRNAMWYLNKKIWSLWGCWVLLVGVRIMPFCTTQTTFVQWQLTLTERVTEKQKITNEGSLPSSVSVGCYFAICFLK